MAGHTTLKKCCASLLVGLWAVLGGAEAMAPRGTTNYIKLVNRNRPASIQKIYKIVGRAGAAAAVVAARQQYAMLARRWLAPFPRKPLRRLRRNSSSSNGEASVVPVFHRRRFLEYAQIDLMTFALVISLAWPFCCYTYNHIYERDGLSPGRYLAELVEAFAVVTRLLAQSPTVLRDPELHGAHGRGTPQSSSAPQPSAAPGRRRARPLASKATITLRPLHEEALQHVLRQHPLHVERAAVVVVRRVGV